MQNLSTCTMIVMSEPDINYGLGLFMFIALWNTALYALYPARAITYGMFVCYSDEYRHQSEKLDVTQF